ncbi:MAG: 4Fe-4S dicluster domain-containing protein [Nitrospira sp.]|nr:4Fe-4S dicluster domain-containing protein [Nitrospira sp.]
MANKKYSMVIDLQKCVGCGACAIACKTENNTQLPATGQTFHWADFAFHKEGKFPDLKYASIPVLCNHCDDPACLKGCPEPKALYKTEDGITMYNYRFCIQCKKCYEPQDSCPYSSSDVEKEGDQHTVISFNQVGKDTHGFWRDKAALIKGCTSSPAAIADKAGITPPRAHEYSYNDRMNTEEGQQSRGKGKLADVRKDGWIEKCHFCIHRVRNGEDPYCVVSCPSSARVFGDRNDPGSEVSKLLKKYKPKRLKNNRGEYLKDGEKGTGPNVFYVREFSPAKKS